MKFTCTVFPIALIGLLFAGCSPVVETDTVKKSDNQQWHFELQKAPPPFEGAVGHDAGIKFISNGGDVVVLDFLADGDIVYGYFDLYLLGERKEITIGQSEHVKFIEDKTVFKGTARYDGAPTIAEGFGMININNTNPTTTVTFAPDSANASE